MLKKIMMTTCLGLLFFASVLGQEKSAAPVTKPDWPTFPWIAGNPACDSALYQGREVKSIYYKGTNIIVLFDDTGDYLAFLVHVTNQTPNRLVVNPASAFVKIDEPVQTHSILLSIPPDKVAKSLEHQGRWRSIFGAFLGGMATRTSTGTITDAAGNQSTVTLSEPDVAAQRDTQRAIRERADRNEASANIIREIGLKANTVFPNTYLVGWIFFEKKKFASLTVNVFTGAAMYQFPFKKQAH
jgi:hypothetical protein